MQFYRKVYLGCETQPPEDLFVNWRNLPPRLDGWMGVGALDINRYNHLLNDIGCLIVDTGSAYFKRFHDSDKLRMVARNLDQHLDELQEAKEIVIKGKTYDRSDIREISRVFTKLADSDYYAELRY